jgi:glycosyltransferase involved in cell wall biosynthesis
VHPQSVTSTVGVHNFETKLQQVRPAQTLAAVPRVLFLGLGYAGHRTRFLNLRDHTARDARIEASYAEVTGWHPSGRLERMPLLPSTIKGRLRALAEASAIAKFPRPDVIWTSALEVVMPHLWTQLGPNRRPFVFDLDCTFDQLEDQAPVYFERPARSGIRRHVLQAMERCVWSTVTKFTAWSNWAADGLRQAGISEDRICVLPPGVNLHQWRPRPDLRAAADGPLRLVFVGGDFNRKGGPLLLELMRERFRGRCELDVVTRDAVQDTPGVRVHRAEANSSILRELYARADLFVLPTHAECFGIATIEAMASGLPVIMGDVGGARDIVEPGQSGWLVRPTADSVADAVGEALARRNQLRPMGQRGRALAELRFDGERNDALLVDLLLDQAARART